MPRLLGYLAQFASFSTQGELLCTKSLAYLLRNPDLRRAFSALINDTTEMSIDEAITWRSEFRQERDGGRPDVEGCRADGRPLVKIEGKLGAPFGDGQLESYLADLTDTARHDCASALLLILVPRGRSAEATGYLNQTMQLPQQGPGRWSIANTTVAVITWEDMIERFSSVSPHDLRDDIAQFDALYRVLNGDDIAPPTTDEEVLRWSENTAWWRKLVDDVTRRLTTKHALLPLGEDGKPTYYRRYICAVPRTGDRKESCYSIGVRDPFDGHRTPLWLRFNRSTGQFRSILHRLENSGPAEVFVRSEGDVWLPLDVPLNVDHSAKLDGVASQVNRILAVAYQSDAPALA